MYNRTPYNKTTYNRTTSIVFEWLATANAETDTSATLKIIRYLDGSAAAVDKRPPPAAGRQRAPAAGRQRAPAVVLRPPPAAGRPPAERRSSPRTCSRVRRTDRPCITTAFLNTPALQRQATGKPLTDTRRSFGRARIRIRRTRTGFPHIHTRSTTIRTR